MLPKGRVNEQMDIFQEDRPRQLKEQMIPKESTRVQAWSKLNVKNDVIKWERGNFDKIVFYSTGEDFWQTTEHSCLFMVNMVHDLLGLNSKVNSTFDFYIKTDRVFTAYHRDRMERLKVELAGLGMKLLRADDKILIFEMQKSIEPKMLEQWVMAEEIRSKKLDAYLMPNTGSTELYVKIRELGRYTILATSRISASGRPFVAKLLGYLETLYDLHIDINDEKREVMLETLGRFSYFVQILNDEKLVDDRKAQRIGMSLHGIRKELSVRRAPK